MSVELVESLQRRISECLTCHGVGYRLDGRNRATTCTCLGDAIYELRLSRSKIPPRFRDLSFKDYMYQNSTTFAKVQKYIEQADKALQAGTSLFLYGPASTGKSMLASCLLKELMRRGHNSGFTTFSSLIGDPAQRRLTEEMTFLCIDKVSEVLDNLVNFRETSISKHTTHGAAILLEGLLSSRAARNQPTILTSRVPIDEISKIFPSLGTTLLGNFLQVECVEGDFRGNRAQERLLQEFGFDQVEG